MQTAHALQGWEEPASSYAQLTPRLTPRLTPEMFRYIRQTFDLVGLLTDKTSYNSEKNPDFLQCKKVSKTAPLLPHF